MNDKEHIQNLIKTKNRRLQILKEQRAKFGELHVPTHIVTEIEDLEAELEELKAQQTKTNPVSTSQFTIDNSPLTIRHLPHSDTRE